MSIACRLLYMKCTKNRHTNNHPNHDQCSHILSSSSVSCKTFSSLSLLRPATAHLNFPLQFLATSLTTNWPVNPLAPNTTMENCLLALAMFCFSCFQRVVMRRAGTGKEFTLWLRCIMGRRFQHGGHYALFNSCIEDVASQVLTVKKEEKSPLNTRKPWERSTKARNIIRKALMALKVYVTLIPSVTTYVS